MLCILPVFYWCYKLSLNKKAMFNSCYLSQCLLLATVIGKLCNDLYICFQSTQLFLGHKVTAAKAQEMGLASESIWPATYQQELIPKVALLASQSAQVSTTW